LLLITLQDGLDLPVALGVHVSGLAFGCLLGERQIEADRSQTAESAH
jgi:hypothetical protein